MDVLSIVGFASFVGVSLWVGARLLLLARGTRQLPELAIGAALFCGGAGFGGSIAVFRMHVLPDTALLPAFAAIMAALELGVVALTLGVWNLFRPGARWARAAFAATVAALAVNYAASLAGFRPDGQRSAFVFWSFNVVGAAAYLWSAFECFRYHALMRRRERLGLVDRELVHRFLLWAIAGSAGASVFLAGMLARLLATGPSHAAILAQSLCGLVAGASIWLAFFPPQVYVRRVVGEQAG